MRGPQPMWGEETPLTVSQLILCLTFCAFQCALKSFYLRAEVGPTIAVGTAIAGGPPRRSVREELPHTAPTLSRAPSRLFG
jgi:hypothetical protein